MPYLWGRYISLVMCNRCTFLDLQYYEVVIRVLELHRESEFGKRVLYKTIVKLVEAHTAFGQKAPMVVMRGLGTLFYDNSEFLEKVSKITSLCEEQ